MVSTSKGPGERDLSAWDTGDTVQLCWARVSAGLSSNCLSSILLRTSISLLLYLLVFFFTPNHIICLPPAVKDNHPFLASSSSSVIALPVIRKTQSPFCVLKDYAYCMYGSLFHWLLHFPLWNFGSSHNCSCSSSVDIMKALSILLRPISYPSFHLDLAFAARLLKVASICRLPCSILPLCGDPQKWVRSTWTEGQRV